MYIISEFWEKPRCLVLVSVVRRYNVDGVLSQFQGFGSGHSLLLSAMMEVFSGGE